MDIDTLGTLKHINIRKEGKSEKILAVDLKLVAEISADALIEFHPLIAAGERKLAELNAAMTPPAIGRMSDHTPPPPRRSLTELAEPPVTAVTPQTRQIDVDASLMLSIDQTGCLHMGPYEFTPAQTCELGRFLMATRGVWLNFNTRDQHAE